MAVRSANIAPKVNACPLCSHDVSARTPSGDTVSRRPCCARHRKHLIAVLGIVDARHRAALLDIITESQQPRGYRRPANCDPSDRCPTHGEPLITRGSARFEETAFGCGCTFASAQAEA